LRIHPVLRRTDVPIELAKAEIIDAAKTLGTAHGVFGFKFNARTFKALTNLLNDPAHKEHLILWYKAGPDKYPELKEIEDDGPAKLPNGGVRRKCDAGLGTFGVYEIDKKEAVLLFWVDFDHWPCEFDEKANKIVPKPALKDGHKHVKGKFGHQNSLDKEDFALAEQLLKVLG
jgi:hypothetical protein